MLPADKLLSLINALGGIVWEAEPETLQFLFVSEEAERILGYPRRTWLEEPDFWVRHTHPDDVERCASLYRRASDRGEDHELEYRMIAADGRIVWLRDIVSVCKSADGSTRLVGLAVDITNHKRAEVSQQQLAEATRMDAVGRLAGGVAHDFNNLLTVIAGYAELVAATLDAADLRAEDLGEIKRAAHRASLLTRQLLAFSRKQTLKVVPTDLNGIIVSMRNMLERLIGEDIAIQSRLAEHLPQVLADRVQIEQVVLNLIMNARDAMPRGGVIAIETRPVESGAVESAAHEQVTPGRYVELIISDTGQGMDGATQARIFEPFFTTKGAGEGTGLGLATVYGVVQQLGGHIAVTSIIGRGTTFSLYFPECTQISHPLDPVAKKSSPAPLASGREVVLVVEDQRGVRQLAARILTRHGYMVCEAADAVEAIKIASNPRQPIDLVVSDVVMPKMGGPELMERLWALRPALKVLYMSGYTGDELSRRVGQETSITVLEKPFSASALLQTVRDVLDESDFFVAGSHPPAST